MSTAHSSLGGSPPEVRQGQGNPEALKYGKLWELSEYRKVAPGEELAALFLQHARPRPGAEVLDFGCGTGRGALMLAVLGRCKVTMIDFVRNCLDPEIREALTTQAHALTFLKADLEQPLPVAAEYGYCTDVMEHIPPDKVDRVLDNLLKAARHVFFSIATTEDKCGALIGEPLHLTVQPYSWWLRKLNERDAVIHWSVEEPGACRFYVTAWRSGQDVVKTGVLNVEEETIRANVAHNIAQGWQQVHPQPTNNVECMILGGGPSMPAFEEEIKTKRAQGVKLITLNGAYNWALDHGLTPSAQIIVDARPFNARFTKPVVPGFKRGDQGAVEGPLYFIASQCDPSVFEGLPKDRTYLFHTMTALTEDLLIAQYGQVWHSIPGGSTALLRAIPLLRLLGFTRFHLYGCDSCLKEGEHHAYAQAENDHQVVIPVTTNHDGRIFYCHGWMISQAQELLDLIRVLGDEIELAIHGDGLLAHLLETGAALQMATDVSADGTATSTARFALYPDVQR
jgi:2-polyprenyl-3-methyl-5-hydroxy-6-metoxy-1,4-benzoquinol methylase